MTIPTENAFIQPWRVTLFPGSLAVSSACTFHPEQYQDGLFSLYGIPFEPALMSARRCRRAEFLAGRYLARKTLNAAGIDNFYLEPDNHAGPRWPCGISGSISHSRDTAVCSVLARSTGATVGIDIEPIMGVKEANSLWPHLIEENEYRHFLSLALDFPFLLTLVFSARESLFKALSQQVGSSNAQQAFKARLSRIDEHSLTVSYCYDKKEYKTRLDYCVINQQVMTLANLPEVR